MTFSNGSPGWMNGTLPDDILDRDKKIGLGTRFARQASEYADGTSIHGVKYIAESNRATVER